MRLDIDPTHSDLRTFVRNFYRHALEYLEPARSEKKGKPVSVDNVFDGPWFVGTYFRRFRPPY